MVPLVILKLQIQTQNQTQNQTVEGLPVAASYL
jgi:hypothetical protein